MYVQDLIDRLARFWARKGCAILQPYDMPVGAGTFHPATALRAVLKEPWNAAYVQPSRRPADGRYGRHPNRLQRYYQYQVVMKPMPGDFQDIYLESLEEIGIKGSEHDIRFVEDNWESKTLDAWGLGWEVWVDGMEVTQFTYFQQVGGIDCEPTLGEITYGIERLGMFLQAKDSVYELDWCDGLTYGDLHQHEEAQQSEYNFSTIDSDSLFKQLEGHRVTCEKLLEQEGKMVMAAFDQMLLCSHVFNVLDAHREVSDDQRAALVKMISGLARKVVGAYAKARADAGVIAGQ